MNSTDHDISERLNAIREEIRQKMTNVALWCDGGHSFSARDKGRKSITVTSSDEETGEEDSQTRQFCGGCTPTTELLAEPRTRPAGYETTQRTQIAPTRGDSEI